MPSPASCAGCAHNHRTQITRTIARIWMIKREDERRGEGFFMRKFYIFESSSSKRFFKKNFPFSVRVMWLPDFFIKSLASKKAIL
jgi:hypothetical protein